MAYAIENRDAASLGRHQLGSKQVPGPHKLPLIGLFLEIRSDPLGFAIRTANQHGDIASFRLGGNTVFMVNRPEFFHHVLVDNYRNYHKSDFYKAVRPIFGNGLVTSEDGTWKRQRQLAQPAFHRKQIANISAGMVDEIDLMLDDWQHAARDGSPVDVAAETMELALGNIARAMFGTDVRDEFQTINDAIAVVLRRGEKEIWSPFALPYWVPTPTNLRARRAVKKLDNIVYRVINDRRSGESNGDDLLSMLLSARYEDSGEGMTDAELRDQVLTILVAGHETVGTAASIIFYLISKHPEVERRLTVEIDDVLGGRRPSFADLPRLEYTSMVVQEALRLYPSAWTISRKALKDDMLGEHEIPAGSTVMLSPYVLHRNPKIWPNPEAFVPERFTADEVARRDRTTFVPFGGGPRMCIGANFALTELQLLIARTYQRYRLSAVPGFKLNLEPMISLRPVGGVMMQVGETEKTEQSAAFATAAE